MSQRPWTAILISEGHYSAINITAALEKAAAKQEIEDKHPGRKLVALIPGTHASSAYTFCSINAAPMVGSHRNERFLDPFDTSHMKEE